MRSLHMSFGLKNVNVMNDDGGKRMKMKQNRKTRKQEQNVYDVISDGIQLIEVESY